MNRRTMVRRAGLIALASLTKMHKVRAGYADPFQPTWSSLENFTTPEWFRNAKFGMWAHWGPQCQPEAGDWYARGMYQEGNRQYKLHLEKYGHPSVSGFKEVIHSWKAEKWDPDELVNLYKNAGARYFMALANHHDNFDLFDSRYHRWNSVRMGPKKDLIAGWSKAARQAGLRFAVSVHASHAWNWYEVSQRHDLQGPYKGVAYDGMLQKTDGMGKWWDGEDPQELYAQNHPLSKDSYDNDVVGRQWEWGGGAYPPSAAYADQLHKRIVQLIDSYSPDLVYFDDSKLPLWPVSDVGLRIAAHLYNKSIRDKGRLDAVVTGKILDPLQRKAMVWDIERGQSNAIEPLPWQTDTCIGDWHYDRAIYERKGYKTGKTVIHTLVDVVSKNGNLMLNIPVRGDGTIDEQERAVVEEIGRWMKSNSEGIYDTRPWVVFGEGPAIEGAALEGPGFNEGKGKPFTDKDMRFTTKGGALYVFMMEWPSAGLVKIRSLGTAGGHRHTPVNKVTLLRNGETLKFVGAPDGLVVHLPAGGGYAETLRVE